MATFFSYFPTVLYANNATSNILAKIKFQESVKKNLAVFYSYTVKEGERPDQIAEKYYEDANYDWLIYLSNDIVDPYHQWPRTQAEMESYISTKYGSAANAAAHVAFYRTNYQNDDRVISTAAFNALSSGEKQYWQPIVGYNDAVLNYERKQQDLITETRCTQTIRGTFTDVPEVGTIIKAVIQGGGLVPRGTVAFANATVVTMKHVEGVWAESLVVKDAGTEETLQMNITSVDDAVLGVPDTEVTYWEPVTWFDYEYEQNEAKRNIQLVSSVYVNTIERDMRDLLQP